MHYILIATSSGYEIEVEKFRSCEIETAKYLQKYTWYDMPSAVHKFLINGSEIFKNALLSIDQLTQEAQEVVNKDFKNFSHEKSKRNIFNLLL